MEIGLPICVHFHVIRCRVGRSATAKALDEQVVRLAVIAHIRHAETPYDALLARGEARESTRAQVEPAMARVLRQ